MKSHEIKGALQMAGWSLTDVAESYGCQLQFVSRVVAGEATSRGVQSYIAGILRLPVKEVWGE